MLLVLTHILFSIITVFWHHCSGILLGKYFSCHPKRHTDTYLTASFPEHWILMKQEMMGWQWHQLDNKQIICTLLQTDNLIIFTGRMLFLTPNQQCQSNQ